MEETRGIENLEVPDDTRTGVLAFTVAGALSNRNTSSRYGTSSAYRCDRRLAQSYVSRFRHLSGLFGMGLCGWDRLGRRIGRFLATVWRPAGGTGRVSCLSRYPNSDVCRKEAFRSDTYESGVRRVTNTLGWARPLDKSAQPEGRSLLCHISAAICS